MDDTQNDAKNLDKKPSTWPGRYPGPHNARPENQNTLVHGGAAARKALTTGAEFHGPAKDAELAVRDELAVNGRVSIVERAAIRLQAASDLYWNALIQAGEAGDTKAVNSYAKSFGWLQSKALTAWQQLKLEQQDASPETTAIEVLKSIKGGSDSDAD